MRSSASLRSVMSGQVGDHAGGALAPIGQRRQGQAGPEHLARFFSAPHFHHAPALLRQRIVEQGFFLCVQEQDVARRRLEQRLIGPGRPAGIGLAG
jgi:hypothetical protein